MNRLLRWLQQLFRTGNAEEHDGWQEELESHIALRAEWNERHGQLSPAEAHTKAKQQFGSTLHAYEQVRAIHIAAWFDDLACDLRHAFRVFRHSPALSLAVVATMAVGLGAATAVFSIIDPLLFRPLPYAHGERLVSVGITAPIDANELAGAPMYFDWRRSPNPFGSITTSRLGQEECDVSGSAPARLDCLGVGSNFLDVLGVHPILGRMFNRQEDRPNAPKSVLISNGLWHSRYGGRPSVLGTVFRVNNEDMRIVGVLPATFVLPQGGSPDILMPQQLDEAGSRDPRRTVFTRVFARLKPGVSLEQARAQMVPLFEESLQMVPRSLRKEIRLVLRSVRERQIQDARLGSGLLLGAVCLLLLMVCTNIASLLLGQAAARETELATRAALGAGRARLVRQSLAESLLLGILGGACGCLVSVGLLHILVALAPGGFLHLETAHIDARVLSFSLFASLVCALLFGIVPALHRPSAESLKGDRVSGTRRSHVRYGFVIAQVALSVMLLACAALFGRSLRELVGQSLGFQSQHLIAASVSFSAQSSRNSQQLNNKYDVLESDLASIPGVASLSISDTVPPAGGVHGRPFSNLMVAGHKPLPPGGGTVAFRYITPSYFETLGIPILQGRDFINGERTGAETSLILSRSLAAKLFGTERALGQRISLDGGTEWLTVIGIAADAKNTGLAAPAEPEYYRLRMRSSDQLGNNVVVALRTTLSPSAVGRLVEKEVAKLEPGATVNVQSMDVRIRNFNDPPRFLATVVGIFAVVGLLLAAVGLYGVMAFLVGSRTREIGIRAALGATARDIALLIQGRASTLVIVGCAFGLGGALLLTHLVRALLFGISPYDPLSLLAPIALLFLTGAFAAWRPARRAAAIDPASALRVH